MALNPYLQISRDAARALEEFSDEFRSALALGDFPTWAASLGFVRDTDAIKTTYPVPISAASFHEFDGDMKFRSLYHRSLSMQSKKWQDGISEFANVIEAPDFIDWAGEPARIATEWLRQPNILVADMLALNSLAGPLLNFYDDVDSGTINSTLNLFDTHPFNVFKTGLGDFTNILTTTEAEIESGAFFDAANDYFTSILGPNGRPLGLSFSSGGTCLIPSTRETLFKNTLQFDTIVNTIRNVAATENVAAVTRNNIYKGTVAYQRADELADQDHFYAIAPGTAGGVPWIVQRSSSPEEFVLDKSSEEYMKTLKVSISYVGQMAAAACLPHRIARVEITG
jgi:hypothetical protein